MWLSAIIRTQRDTTSTHPHSRPVGRDSTVSYRGHGGPGRPTEAPSAIADTSPCPLANPPETMYGTLSSCDARSSYCLSARTNNGANSKQTNMRPPISSSPGCPIACKRIPNGQFGVRNPEQSEAGNRHLNPSMLPPASQRSRIGSRRERPSKWMATSRARACLCVLNRSA